MFVLELKDVSKYYEYGGKREHIFKNVNLKVKSGDFIVIVGPSGCGKSTMLHIIGLLQKSDNGEVLFDGCNCNELSDKVKARIRCEKIGFVYQSCYLLSDFSVMNNIILPGLIFGKNSKKAIKNKAITIIEQLNIVNTLHKKISDLSGGEKQRVAIARAVINSPQLILADEPTGNLDSKNSEEVFSLFTELARSNNSAVIMVTHDLNLAKKADQVLHIEDLERS